MSWINAGGHEDVARWRKVARLLAALYKHGVPPEAVASFDGEDWAKVAKVASVREPSEVSVGWLTSTLAEVPGPAGAQ